MKEAYPLVWPDGQPRTQIRDREERKAWKGTEKKAIEALNTELKRFKVLMSSAVVTRQDPHDIRSAPDPSVSVWFSRSKEDDFSWQSALGISNPAPSLDEINSAFRTLSAKHHPDSISRGSGGDLEIFHALSKHKDKAVAFAKRITGRQNEFVIACDKFAEVRWNIAAIAHTIRSFRQMERDGTSRILEQAMEGFKPALTSGAPEASHAATGAAAVA
jgi:hypothetical protein